ncbi:MAG: hypothetical protein Q4C09_06840 [Atopobiaceae bacterium]|nr:hypothetical protein [Atopobiaceae bacterium]
MFCDEAGQQNMSAGYYLLTLVLHDQSSTPLVLWDERALAARMRRDIVNFAYDHLEWFQSFEKVPVYYDEGQQAVTSALHLAFDLILGEQVVEWRLISYQDYRLAQVADYLCSVELACMRYREGSYSRTYRKFYGQSQSFRRNFLKPARRKLMP